MNKNPSSCPDCNGTGEYVGLNKRTKCQTCNGVVSSTEAEALQPVSIFNWMSRLKPGDLVHVFDGGWYITEVIAIKDGIVHTGTLCDFFDIPIYDLTFNVTQDRWEYIRAGTPIWP